jgi:hypothetical protein
LVITPRPAAKHPPQNQRQCGPSSRCRHSPVQRQRGQEYERRVDLRALALVDELERGEHRDARPQAGARVPQARGEVLGAPQRAQRGEQRRQQEAPAPAAEQRARGRQQPEEQRRLVGVQLHAAMREQEVARGEHLLRDEHEPRLVGGPRVAQAVAHAERDDGD